MSRLHGFLKVWIFALALIGLVQPSMAATNLDLYVDSAVVRQQADQAELDEAIQQAFKSLLVRISGVQQVLDVPEIQSAIKDSRRFVATSRFEPSDETFTNILGESVPTKRMVMRFDSTEVDRLLVQNRQPVWGAKRPDVLLWLADRTATPGAILTDGSDSQVLQALRVEAQSRGIPLLFPLMDLQDSLVIEFTDVYGLFSQDIAEASERYGAEAQLAGRLLAGGSEGEFKADWLMLFQGERLRLPTVAGTLDEVVEQGLDLVAERLSAQYALIMDPLLFGTLDIEVTGIEDIKVLAEVERYLSTINLITQVQLAKFDELSATYRLNVSGDRQQLKDIFALDGRLVPNDATSLEAQLDQTLSVRWQTTQGRL